MIRKIIKIDEAKCNGCGLCATACHEGAIEMIEGKARLTKENYCDGLGDCLPACPTGAIVMEEREAPVYDEAAVQAAKRSRKEARVNKKEETVVNTEIVSEIGNWPVQIKLLPVRAPFYDGANLLVAADCTAFAYGSFHRDFMRGRVALIGCPKLDSINYADKLGEIIRNNDIAEITVVRMEVPCCGGLEYAVRTALEQSGKDIPLRIEMISIKGKHLTYYQKDINI